MFGARGDAREPRGTTRHEPDALVIADEIGASAIGCIIEVALIKRDAIIARCRKLLDLSGDLRWTGIASEALHAGKAIFRRQRGCEPHFLTALRTDGDGFHEKRTPALGPSLQLFAEAQTYPGRYSLYHLRVAGRFI